MRRFAAFALSAVLCQPFETAWAQQATAADQITQAYGARIGVRNERPGSPGLSQDMRAARRLPTRINSRLATRIERYADPDRILWAYAAAPDDGSRQSTTEGVAPTQPPRSVASPVTARRMDSASGEGEVVGLKAR
jgi:hypothetical protein